MANLEEVKEETYTIIRDGVLFRDVSAQFLDATSFSLDGIVMVQSDGKVIGVRDFSHRMLTDKDFLSRAGTVGATSHDTLSVNAIYEYLRYEGKIPSYIYFEWDGRLCIKTRSPISAGTILGSYQGVFRPVENNGNMQKSVRNMEGKVIGVYDADNLNLSNWTRYLGSPPPVSASTAAARDGNPISAANCTFVSKNFNVLLFATRDIKADEELFVND